MQIVGILNVTPDSYVDGGQYTSLTAALARAKEVIEQGGSIIEVGGESTGPGSLDVSVAEESARVIPVVEAIHNAMPNVQISVDTWKASIADAALQAGASMINDVTAGRGDADMFDVISRHGCSYIMMYAKDATARTTKEMREYDDVIATVSSFLQHRIDAAVARGIDRSRIIIDPGLGHFISADPAYSFEILRRLHEFTAIAPVLVSPSRKSFLAGDPPLPVSKRLPATLAATTTAVLNGASFIRTHDVEETKQVCDAALKMKK